MIIIIKKSGQTCNRLFQYAHFYAYCKEHNIELLNPTFRDLRNVFNTEMTGNDSIRTKLELFIKVILYTLKGNLMNIDSPEKNLLAMSLLKNKDYLVWGWCFRDAANFCKYADDIRDFFRINSVYIKKVENELLEKRKVYDSIVGVHIRRGDYSTWNDGKYYFDDSEYVSIIEQMSSLMPFKKVLFIICSNESVNVLPYKDLERNHLGIWIPQSNFVEELFLLSKCDKIIGPPSTFTLWASFYGNIPYLHIEEKNFKIKEQDFKVCLG